MLPVSVLWKRSAHATQTDNPTTYKKTLQRTYVPLSLGKKFCHRLTKCYILSKKSIIYRTPPTRVDLWNKRSYYKIAFMEKSQERTGELILIFEIFLWSFFPIIATISYATLGSLASLFWITTFSAGFFITLIAYRTRWQELKKPLVWKYASYAAISIGILYYGLYFLGLSKTTPGNASIVAQFEVLSSFLFFNVLKREKMSGNHLIGATLMLIGACIVLSPRLGTINTGDVCILLATFCAPPGNYFTQKARKMASAETILFMRSIVTGGFLFLLAYILHTPISVADIRPVLTPLLINGVIVFGLSKTLWVEAINILPVTKAIALGSAVPFCTMTLAWFILHEPPTLIQFSALIPMIFGTLLLTNHIRFLKTKV